MSIDVEEGLCKSMSDAGVTIITISKYAALKRIGDFLFHFWLTFCPAVTAAFIWLIFFCPSG